MEPSGWVMKIEAVPEWSPLSKVEFRRVKKLVPPSRRSISRWNPFALQPLGVGSALWGWKLILSRVTWSESPTCIGSAASPQTRAPPAWPGAELSAEPADVTGPGNVHADERAVQAHVSQPDIAGAVFPTGAFRVADVDGDIGKRKEGAPCDEVADSRATLAADFAAGFALSPVTICGPYSPALIRIESPGRHASQAASIEPQAALSL